MKKLYTSVPLHDHVKGSVRWAHWVYDKNTGEKTAMEINGLEGRTAWKR